MSQFQYRTLRYLIGHNATIEELRSFNLTTLGSLLQRGWVKRDGDTVTVTKQGAEAYDSYRLGGPNFKKHEGDLSDRVRLMLHMRAMAVGRETRAASSKEAKVA